MIRLCAVAALAMVGLLAGCDGGPRDDGAELAPVDAVAAVLEATGEYQLVALGEYHLMQEWHDFIGVLLRQPGFASNVDDIVVEFGNGLYQEIADRFLLDLEPVEFPELSQIWRNTIGGRVLWDAPVYEQFYRNVRETNQSLPREQRIRVLLGDPDVDFSQVRSATDTAELQKGVDRDGYYAGVVEREVIAEGRTAVLIAGADHLRRDVHSNAGPQYPNVATLLDRAHPGELFIVYPLPFEYDNEVGREVERALASWARPALAYLDGAWLGAQPVSHRALVAGSIFEDQVDAVVWFGPKASLTASRPDPAIYQSGEYAAELQRRSRILSEFFGEDVDYVAEGLRLATSGPRLL